MVTGFVDSAVFIDVLRSYAPAVAWLQSQVSLGVASPVWIELMIGAWDKHEQTDIRKLLNQFDLFYLTQTDQYWAIQQATAYGLSHGVDALDCQIASVSQRLQIPLYTRNLKHFAPLLGVLAQKPY